MKNKLTDILEEYVQDIKSQLCCNNDLEKIDYITYDYTEEEIDSNVSYFEKCMKQNLSGYKALLFLNDYLLSKQDFKQKYFTNNFYWVDKENYKQLQEIAIVVGCLCHTGKPEIIEWHEGFKNLGFRTYEKNNNITVFQKEPFLLGNEEATNFEEMLLDYKNL